MAKCRQQTATLVGIEISNKKEFLDERGIGGGVPLVNQIQKA